MPQVINLKDTKGKLPDGAVLIDRRTRWGNPFRVEQWGRALAVLLYKETASGSWNPTHFSHLTDEEYKQAYALREQWLRRLGHGHPWEIIRGRLKGKDLACWCAPELCHGEVLLEMANEKTYSSR